MAKVKVLSTVKKTSRKIVRAPKVKLMVKTIKKTPLNQEQIEESIRSKAYELYLLRLGQEGSALTDWLSAERLILKT